MTLSWEEKYLFAFSLLHAMKRRIFFKKHYQYHDQLIYLYYFMQNHFCLKIRNVSEDLHIANLDFQYTVIQTRHFLIFIYIYFAASTWSESGALWYLDFFGVSVQCSAANTLHLFCPLITSLPSWLKLH